MRLIDADALMEYCNNLVDHSIDANDIARFPTAMGWISVNVLLPDKPIRYIICAVERGHIKHITTALYAVKTESFIMTGKMAYWKVTHWMPFPEPPKDGDSFA